MENLDFPDLVAGPPILAQAAGAPVRGTGVEDELTARSDDLRARGAALSGTGVDPDTRASMEARRARIEEERARLSQ
ncbi:MAG: hypothetical protein AAFR47_11530 [Pseudomonadota bacterium]